MSDMNQIVGSHDLVMLTLDTLRYDIAQSQWRSGNTPNLAEMLRPSGWERRHSPASFTFAAHQAFFAGFLPTPARPGKHERLFAARFLGSETTTGNTCVFEQSDIVSGLASRGYHTLCIGGVGFFNKATPLGSVLPALFEESHWSSALGVTSPDSTGHQFRLLSERLQALGDDKPVFAFINISALHQPNCMYLQGAAEDSLETHAAALRYVDAQVPILTSAMEKRTRPTFFILCSDHGTAYGEDGYYGHRIGHPSVWDVPFATATRG